MEYEMSSAKKAIHINIWDDYRDNESVPGGEIQETYAYIEGGSLPDEAQRNVLLALQSSLLTVKKKGVSGFECVSGP
jgi:hypothetical protein